MANNNNATAQAATVNVDVSRFTRDRLARMAKQSNAEYESGNQQPGGPANDGIERITASDIVHNRWPFALLRDEKTNEPWVTEYLAPGEKTPWHTVYAYFPTLNGVRKFSLAQHNVDKILAMSDSEIDDRLWMLTQLPPTRKGFQGAIIIVRAHRAEVNDAVSNRQRVSQMRDIPMPQEDEEEEEYDEEDEDVDEEEEYTPPARKSSSSSRNNPKSAVNQRARQTAPVKPVKPAKKNVEPGTVQYFGSGEQTRGRGRPPTAVTEYLATGHDVFFSRKSGKYFMDDRKTVLYAGK